MVISIIHPSRSRPKLAFETFKKWMLNADMDFDYLSDDENKIEYILSLDMDDNWGNYSCFNDIEISRCVKIVADYNSTAITAINKAAKISAGNLLVVISDDQEPCEHWDTLLLAELEGKSDFVVKTQDGIQKVLVTLPIVDRVWYERYGYIYHPDYLHMSCDVELTASAIMQGKLIYSKLLFRHNHYSTGATPKDSVNERNDLTYKQGDEVLKRHLSNNFGIENPVCAYDDIVWHPVEGPKLSILIATMPSRTSYLFRLAGILTPQLTDEVEVIIDCSMDYNIGVKRNKLLAAASGEYVVFIDDDDLISEDYVAKILTATGADCMGISGVITTNNGQAKQWHISKDYKFWHELNGVYLRTPNHISPVRRELALQAGFPEIEQGEDAEYSRRLYPLLKTENKVEGNIYWYQFVSV